MWIRFMAVNILLLLFISGVSAQSEIKDSVLTVDDKMFEKVEIEASYPGGSSAWIKFLSSRLNGSIPAENNAPAGYYTVIVQFIVNKDSSISEIQALTHHGYGMEQEVIRALRLSGKWIPAEQGGRRVRAYRKQPVTFWLDMDGADIQSEKPWTLYLKKDNLVTITADKVKDENLLVTVSHGTVIKNGNGQYLIRLSKKERVVIRLTDSKKNKRIGEAIYEVVE